MMRKGWISKTQGWTWAAKRETHNERCEYFFNLKQQVLNVQLPNIYWQLDIQIFFPEKSAAKREKASPLSKEQLISLYWMIHFCLPSTHENWTFSVAVLRFPPLLIVAPFLFSPPLILFSSSPWKKHITFLFLLLWVRTILATDLDVIWKLNIQAENPQRWI